MPTTIADIIAHGTLRPVEYVMPFALWLHSFDTNQRFANVYNEANRAAKLLSVLDAKGLEPHARYTADCYRIILDLEQALIACAPDGYYFGYYFDADGSDGSGFGFWPLTAEEE